MIVAKVKLWLKEDSMLVYMFLLEIFMFLWKKNVNLYKKNI
jgi:hypothetical protein